MLEKLILATGFSVGLLLLLRLCHAVFESIPVPAAPPQPSFHPRALLRSSLSSCLGKYLKSQTSLFCVSSELYVVYISLTAWRCGGCSAPQDDPRWFPHRVSPYDCSRYLEVVIVTIPII